MVISSYHIDPDVASKSSARQLFIPRDTKENNPCNLVLFLSKTCIVPKVGPFSKTVCGSIVLPIAKTAVLRARLLDINADVADAAAKTAEPIISDVLSNSPRLNESS